ncbi:hypothetical protein BDZ94DRAFT_1260415 [Collybia nuda]|uniref:CBM1 domain-containing protein n=1 Tax=Collybia nuda TaxID=64659 RepID=A0A9P6CI05_9AGAR|nr:hypothetical protein BDZ94DRAFT_1260415 [Collybia nuda]
MMYRVFLTCVIGLTFGSGLVYATTITSPPSTVTIPSPTGTGSCWTTTTVIPVGGVPLWSQCGGIGWTGASNCRPGSHCQKINDYYSQCQPDDASTVVTAITRTVSICS